LFVERTSLASTYRIDRDPSPKVPVRLVRLSMRVAEGRDRDLAHSL
jgi:hypothetical protein